MALKDSQKKFLRGMGHALKPVISIGNAGLSESVLKEFTSTIAHHELIKVRVRAADRDARDALIAEMGRETGAELVSRIGNVALMYRRNPDAPRIPLPN